MSYYTIKQILQTGPMSFPFYKQLDTFDCGPSCLRMICSFYGNDYSAHFIRSICHINKQGVSFFGIRRAAETVGFNVMTQKLSWEDFVESHNGPCIVHWNHNHFVVVYKIKRTRSKYKIYVADPAVGLVDYSIEEFKKYWIQTVDGSDSGISMFLEPLKSFYDNSVKTNKYDFKFILKYLSPYKKSMSVILIAMLFTSLASIAFPYIMQQIVDKGIGNKDVSFIVLLLIAQSVLVFGQLLANLLKSWLSLHMTVKISVSLISDFLNKLMSLPIAFFDSKRTGDIIQRIEDHSRIQTFLTGALLSIIIAATSFIVYSIVMVEYSIKILIVFILGSTLYLAWILFFLNKRKKLDHLRFNEASANKNNIIQMIGGMQEIKLNNCELQKKDEWERIQDRLYKISLKSLNLGQIQEIGATSINQLKNMIISFMSATAVINEDMTLGMMMSLQYVIGQLSVPLQQFIQFSRSVQDASISMERMGEIHNKEDEEPKDIQKVKIIPDNADITFSNVSFQYDGPESEMVLKDVTFTVPANKITAIVGTSGSGKTTLIKMMLGFYHPTTGSIKLGGIALSDISDMQWRKQCGVVMQDGYIFSDMISGNIGISDAVKDMDAVKAAAKLSNIDEWIERLPLGYNTKIGMEGHGLSTGQKQRILIARAVYKNAKYLFFDEATNALDAHNEAEILDNLYKLFKDRTVVVVAHRLSTVKKADNIIVLHKGIIVEEGKHEYLISRRGYYYSLVKNQLELGD